LGDATRLTQNNYLTYGPLLYSTRMVNIGLMGDPTLRLRMIAPPTALAVGGTSQAALSWTASADAGRPGFRGYHVYRASTVSGTFARLTSAPVTATGWVDAG